MQFMLSINAEFIIFFFKIGKNHRNIKYRHFERTAVRSADRGAQRRLAARGYGIVVGRRRPEEAREGARGPEIGKFDSYLKFSFVNEQGLSMVYDPLDFLQFKGFTYDYSCL